MASIDHIGFILSAYAAAVVVVGLLVAWIALDYRLQRRRLADLETRGVARRSAAGRSERPTQRAKEEA
jgi:heme exporter protein D